MAIDYGRKRVGIAVTDPMQIIATGLKTVQANEIFIFFKAYFAKEKVDAVVVGYPRQMNNEASESVKYINPFIKKLKKEWPDMLVELQDERFTSKMASQAMIDGGLKKKDRQNKALVDEISATIILQSYMERKKI